MSIYFVLFCLLALQVMLCPRHNQDVSPTSVALSLYLFHFTLSFLVLLTFPLFAKRIDLFLSSRRVCLIYCQQTNRKYFHSSHI